MSRPRKRQTLGQFPPLKQGRDLPTLVANTLSLFKGGMSKGDAMATALNIAGYRPPSTKTTKPSSAVH